MNPIELVKTALGAMAQNKIRASLTILGIAIGVAAVIAVIAVGKGAEQDVQEQIERYTAYHLQVSGFWDRETHRWYPIKVQDLEAIRREVDRIELVIPLMWVGGTSARYRHERERVGVQATTPDIFKVRGYDFAQGVPFSNADDFLMKRVVVLGGGIASRLFGDVPDRVGRAIQLGSHAFNVVGVLEENPDDRWWGGPDDMIVVPLQTGRAVFGGRYIADVYLKATNPEYVEAVAMDVERTLRRSRQIQPGEQNTFRMRNTLDMAQIRESASKTFSDLLQSIAAISLIVGGLGIVNIMLVSVTERTSEIGIRKAIGARRSTILAQFLTEAVLLCLIGGIVGVGGGISISEVLVEKFGWKVIVSPDSIVLGVAVAAGVGVIAGMWPAWRAARMDPVVALSHE